ncbi:MAG: hypothetical protein A2020_03615 [Lentisphaerae bacterium GWF2_45_14]|nr:MAG: hypothetical protein A2020_03615 [Lentisphaerae bacterium GWF2_45_14]
MDTIRIWRSPDTRFGVLTKELDNLENETMTANAVYTDSELAGIAKSGFNAIWVHGLLRNIVKSKVFPEFGKYSSRHLKSMNELIERAAKYGIKVFIYMQPPRAIWKGSAFWKKHGDVAGCVEESPDHDENIIKQVSLCTSTDKVKKYLKASSAELAKKLPGLGGVILITASEYPSHCWARRGKICDAMGHYHDFNHTTCPKCAKRKPGDIVNEVIKNVRDGIKSVDKSMEIVAWNWSWNAYEKDPSPEIIKNLPKDVIYMADFERGSKKKILGKDRPIDEYSLSFNGPSERFSKSTQCAKKAGLKIMTKLQFGTTHELATVPNIPLIANIFDKANHVRSNKITGFMGCWNFGNMLTANTAAFNYFLTGKKHKTKKAALEAFASEYLPKCDEKKAAAAWMSFSKAMDNYPFSIPFLYASPINYTLAFPIKPGHSDDVPCGRSWLMDKVRGNSLEASLGPYTLDEVIKGLGKTCSEWEKGLEKVREALASSPSRHAEDELDTAETCGHVFRSAWNTYRSWKLTRKWNKAKMKDFIKIAKNEIENLEKALPILRRDKRQGFHGEAFGYMFNSELVSKKIKALKDYIS